MMYFGGKSRNCQLISQYLWSVSRDYNQIYVEPFVGGASVMSQMDRFKYRLACDKHPQLIAMYQELQKGWEPPTSITEEEYYAIRDNISDCPDYLRGFVGFGCSFGGKWGGVYAKDNKGRNYCLEAHNSILKKMRSMQNVTFKCLDYRQLTPKDCLVYCDPPYADTGGFSVGSFDTEEFWEIMREWSKINTVVISEYVAPLDFKCVWAQNNKILFNGKRTKKEIRVEKLFQIIP